VSESLSSHLILVSNAAWQGKRNKLTLVSAPAGSGKSVLVSQWVERQELPFTWLSLDEDDSDLRFLLAYLLAAIGTVAIVAYAQQLSSWASVLL